MIKMKVTLLLVCIVNGYIDRRIQHGSFRFVETDDIAEIPVIQARVEEALQEQYGTVDRADYQRVVPTMLLKEAFHHNLSDREIDNLAEFVTDFVVACKSRPNPTVPMKSGVSFRELVGRSNTMNSNSDDF